MLRFRRCLTWSRATNLRPDQVEKIQVRSLARGPPTILSDPSKYESAPRKRRRTIRYPYVIAAALVDRQVTARAIRDE